MNSQPARPTANLSRNFLVTTLGATLALFMCACSSDVATAPAEQTSERAANPTTSAPAAAATPQRSDADLQRDLTSKPGQVLKFFGVQPGMQVADLFSGGGYYSELLAAAVGPQGTVVAHNNAPYASFAGDAPAQRYADNRLANVRYLVSEADDLQLPSQLDMVLMVMSFHDAYWINEKQGWPAIDNSAFNTQIFASLKSGGSLAIVDHAAVAGSGRSAVDGLHRIDEQFVISELEAAGFVLAERSDVLSNPADDRSLQVFDPAIRGKTDRFVLRFEKP